MLTVSAWVKNKMWLAPMAGYSDSPYRLLCREFGATKLFSEMVSIEGLARGDNRSKVYLKILEGDNPLSVQLFGTNVEAYIKATEYLNTLDYVDGININSGCPVKKVIKTGSGVMLMKNPKLIKDIIASIRKHTKKELSIKIRAGWDEKSLNALEISKIAEGEGADFVIVHARTAKMGYSGEADWSLIKNIKENLSIKVVGNGDIKSLVEAEKVKNICDAVMIGRGGLGNPWVFNSSDPNINFKEVLLKHIEYNKMFYKDSFYVNLKKHFSYYFKRISMEKALKLKTLQRLLLSQSLNEMIEHIKEF